MVASGQRALAGILIPLSIFFCLETRAGQTPSAEVQQNPATKPAPKSTERPAPQSTSPPSERDEAQALERAFATAGNNPQAVIKNLQDFLARFPGSPRREQVLRATMKEALQSNDPQTAIVTAEKLLELSPGDPRVLSTVVDLLDRQGEGASREKAILYATRLIERVEKLASAPPPRDVPEGRWQEAQAQIRSAAFQMRGKVYEGLGENEKAMTDYEKSFAAYAGAQVAERMGDLAAKMGKTDLALDRYATAFAFPEKIVDRARRDQLRKKLGSLYVAKYQSEKGLGELLLAHYDLLMLRLKTRFAPSVAPNAGGRDPFDYVLTQPDGAAMRLADYRGKVVVMDFWATWCGPCRVEGKLMERVMQNFRREPRVVFLAVNVDEERDGVGGFIKEEQWTVPVVFGQGLDHLLGVHGLPTLVIFDRGGRVVFRQVGIDPSSFVETVEKSVHTALASAPETSRDLP